MTGRRLRRCRPAVALAFGLAAALSGCSSASQPRPTQSPIRPQTAVAATPSAETPSRPHVPLTPWGGSFVAGAAAHAEPVLAVGNSLYAVESRRLFRLDATSGSVAAQATVPNEVGALSDAVVAAGTLWLSPATDSAGRAVLTGYNPVTLAPVARVALPVARSAGVDVRPLAVSPDGRRLYVALPHTVLGIDPARRAITQRLPVGGAPLIDLAVSADSRRLYVAAQLDSAQTVIDVLDAGTGALLFTKGSAGNVVNNEGLTSSAGGLWVQTSGGMSDHLNFYRGDALRSPTHLGSYAEFGGRPITVTISGSAVWLGADNEVACADPLTGHDRSHIVLPPRGGSTVYLIHLIVAGGRLFGSYQGGTGDDALVVLTPPSQCMS